MSHLLISITSGLPKISDNSIIDFSRLLSSFIDYFTSVAQILNANIPNFQTIQQQRQGKEIHSTFSFKSKDATKLTALFVYSTTNAKDKMLSSLMKKQYLAHGSFPNLFMIPCERIIHKSASECDFKNCGPIPNLPFFNKVSQSSLQSRISKVYDGHELYY